MTEPMQTDRKLHTHKFTKTGKTAKAVNVDMGLDLVDGSTFFDTVQTPDSVKAKTV